MNAEDKSPVWGVTTVPLKFPIPTEGGAKLVEISMREPDGEALEAIEDIGLEVGKEPTIRQLLAIVRALSGLPKAVTDRLHKTDVRALTEALAPLISEGAEG